MGNLGHALKSGQPPRAAGPFRSTGWPTEMSLAHANLNDLGTIADVQCGGWSTAVLNSRGRIYAVGVLDNTDFSERQQSIVSLASMRFPSGHSVTGSQRYEPSTAIKQFSLGRARMLGLSDSGIIWEWRNFNEPAHMIKFTDASKMDLS